MCVLAAELHHVSPAAYRMLQNFGSVVLPRILIKQLLSNGFPDPNLKQLFQPLQPQQRPVNILVDEVKLMKTHNTQEAI